MHESQFAVRNMEPGEEEAVCALVRQIFTEFVAPHYEDEGIREFLRYLDPQLMAERMQSDHYVLLAEKDVKLAGAIEIRDFGHISLLFVIRDCQRHGIARQLIAETLKIGRRAKPNLSWVSVHASPNSVMAYEALGFRAEGPEKEEHGIRYIPMRRVVRNENDG